MSRLWKFRLALAGALPFLAGCHHRAPQTAARAAPLPVYRWTARKRTVPAGALIDLTVVRAVRTATPLSGIPAVITRDVLNRDGHVLIPRGSPAYLSVERSRRALSLRLATVMVNGNSYAVAPLPGRHSPSVERVGGPPAPGARTEIGGQFVRIPENAHLRFRLNSPLRIR